MLTIVRQDSAILKTLQCDLGYENHIVLVGTDLSLYDKPLDSLSEYHQVISLFHS